MDEGMEGERDREGGRERHGWGEREVRMDGGRYRNGEIAAWRERGRMWEGRNGMREGGRRTGGM